MRTFRCFCAMCRLRWVQTCACDPATIACPSCGSATVTVSEEP